MEPMGHPWRSGTCIPMLSTYDISRTAAFNVCRINRTQTYLFSVHYKYSISFICAFTIRNVLFYLMIKTLLLWEKITHCNILRFEWITFVFKSASFNRNYNKSTYSIIMHNPAMIDEPPPRAKTSPWGKIMKIYSDRDCENYKDDVKETCITCRTMTWSRYSISLQECKTRVESHSDIIEKSCCSRKKCISSLHESTFQESSLRLITAIVVDICYQQSAKMRLIRGSIFVIPLWSLHYS